ncbi:MAG: hypothetical protein EAX90_11805 [Candidatus Heimdallarchaeota archaeon]|nr:hypothetical protein [Candidatus Heimdallarchaeota archaeon]
MSISISLIVIVGGFLGIAKLLNYIKYNKPDEIEPEADPPILEFIFENTSLISKLEGYGYLGNSFHNGIDFFINATAKIIAPCNMTVTEVVLVYLENADHWAVRTSYTINKDYYMIIGFESFARNETFGNIQLDSIIIELDQEIIQGQLIGELLIHEPSAHIHFGLYKGVDAVCPYQYFSAEAKAIFDTIWLECHPGDNPCNITTITS